MAGRKSVCCGVSALEATLAVLFVLMTAVSVTLITLMATWKTHEGENTHSRNISTSEPEP